MTDEKISFWKFLRENRIEIPKIQRDYAQGRKGKEALRKKFLRDIKAALDTGSVLNLDFIYGAHDSGVLNPLDGQQRLTTLWLLHWYIAYRAKVLGEDGVESTLGRFSYETRLTSRAFCEHLAAFKTFPDANAADKSVANCIRNQSWFRTSWQQDPTVQAMLRAISGETSDAEDSIEGVFGKPDAETWMRYWNQLTGENCPVVFYYLDLAGLRQTDELYIKMNARGEPLTGFENFKADLIDYIHKQSETEELSRTERCRWAKFGEVEGGYAVPLDSLWSSVFWHARSADHRIDEICFAFMNRYLLNSWIVERMNAAGNDAERDPVFDYFYGRNPIANDENADDRRIAYIAFDYYKKPLSIQVMEALFATLTNLDRFVKDRAETPAPPWSEKEDAASVLFTGYAKANGDEAIIRDFAEREIRQIEKISPGKRVAFYAMCRFLQQGWTSSDAAALNDWMRVIWNIIENAQINTIPAMCGGLRLVDRLSAHSHEILPYLATVNPESIGSNFAAEQMQEEILKAKKIVADAKWRSPIIAAEKINCLRGKITVLFRNGESTTLNQFNDGLQLLHEILAIAKTRAYYLQQVLLSRWNHGALDRELNLSENDSAKKELLTASLRDCFRRVSKAEIAENSAPWVNDLCRTKLLTVSRGKIVSPYSGAVVLWGKGEKVKRWDSFGNVIIGNHRALLTTTEGIRLSNENLKLEGTSFISGRNIEFSFAGHWFQWYGVPVAGEFDIYLLKPDWAEHLDAGDIWLEHPELPEKSGDAQTLYCFNVENSDTVDTFQKKLHALIIQASDL